MKSEGALGALARSLKTPAAKYLFGLFTVCLAFVLREALSLALGPDFPEYLMFYPTVMIVALLTGFWPALFSIATTAGIIVALWEIPFHGQLPALRTSNLVSLGLFIGVCVFLSLIAELYRRNREKAAAYDKEQALRESQAALRQQADLLKLSFDAIIVWRLKGEIESWNRGAEELYGFSESEALDRNIRNLLRTSYPSSWTEFEGILRQRRHWEGELRHLTKKGNEVVVFSRLQIGCGSNGEEKILEIDRDITEQKRAQNDLQQAHDELEDKVQKRTSELQKANRMLLMVSRCDEALVQASDERDLTAVISQIIHDEGQYPLVWVGLFENRNSGPLRCVASAGDKNGLQVERLDAAFLEVLAAEAVRSEVPVVRPCPLGGVASEGTLSERGSMAIAAFPLLGMGGSAFGALVICSDKPAEFDSSQINILKELADDLAFGIASLDARQERDQAQRALELKAVQLRALAGEIVRTEERERQRIAQVIHDNLQQQLTATLYGLTSLISTPSKAKREKELKVLSEQLRECINISHSLSSEISHPAFSEANLAAAIKWLLAWMKEKYGLEVELQVAGSAHLVPGETRILLLQAVRELLFNVVKHSGVKKAIVRLDQGLEGRVTITVTDEGVGFDTLKLSGGGRGSGGIGLLSLRERLALAGGGMEATSSPGHGSRFAIWASILQPDVETVAVAVTEIPNAENALSKHEVYQHALFSTPEGEGATIRILLVDDHVVVRKGIGLQLRQQPDMEIVGEASDAETGIELTRVLRPDIVTMDVNMPGMGGIKAVGILHTELPEMPVIGLSMFDEPMQAKAMLDAGAVEYVSKSAGVDILIAAIRSHAKKKASPVAS
jgi:PAS domain S-box-containing protein